MDPDSQKHWVETKLGRRLGRGAHADTEKRQAGASREHTGVKVQGLCQVWVFRTVWGPGMTVRERDAHRDYGGTTRETGEHPSRWICARLSSEGASTRSDGGADQSEIWEVGIGLSIMNMECCMSHQEQVVCQGCGL